MRSGCPLAMAGDFPRRPTLTEAFSDPAKSTFPDACLLRFRISRLARSNHGGVWLCTDWVRTDATTEVVLRLAASDLPSSTLCRGGHCKWGSPNDDGGNRESKDELFHQIPPMSISMSIRSTCSASATQPRAACAQYRETGLNARNSAATPVATSFYEWYAWFDCFIILGSTSCMKCHEQPLCLFYCVEASLLSMFHCRRKS